MRNDWLLQYEKNITSQTGEDGIIEKIMEIIEPNNQWCVEFGAWDGKRHSNTYNLLTNKGWHGVLIEANPQKFKELRETYRGNPNAHPVHTLINFEGTNTLDDVLKKLGIPKNFALLSIDIDGNDYHIWDSLDDYEPEVVIIEYNPSIPNDIRFVQPKDMLINQGSSLLSLTELGKQKGYELVSATTLNGVFVKNRHYKAFQITNNSPAALNTKNKVNETRLYQLYDGTLVLDGCDKLLWKKNFTLTHERIQVLPPEERYFGAAVQSNHRGKPFPTLTNRLLRKLKDHFKRTQH